MGVKGLQSFLKKNAAALSYESELTNTSLVIDANGLSCTLFCNMCEDPRHLRCDIYGRNLVAYGEAVTEFFANLNECAITPILVFDGALQGKPSMQDQTNLREEALRQRGSERLQKAEQMTEEAPDESIIMPQSIDYIFKTIVNDLGYPVERIQAPFDADSHIARIANNRNCFVLSNDTDFIIYSLASNESNNTNPKGSNPIRFVLLDSFEYKNIITKDGRHLIRCKVYSRSQLIGHFPGLRSESIALLGVLANNDCVTKTIFAGAFDRFFKQIRTQNTSSLVTQSFAHRRIATILSWLRNRTVEDSIEYILRSQLVGRGRVEQVERAMRTILAGYNIEQTVDLEAELSEIYPLPRANQSAETISPQHLPSAYFGRLFEIDLHPIPALDMIFHNISYNIPCIDDFELESSSFVCNRPFRLALTLLRPSSSDRSAFHIYDRENGDYCKIRLEPMEHLDGFGSLEHLNCYSMIQLEPERKKSLLMHIFRFADDELNQMTDILSPVFEGQFLSEARTCFMLVKYIALETKRNPNAHFVDALMLTLFYYAKKGNQEGTHRPLSTILETHSFRNNGEHYEPSQKDYRRIMHFISQLEAAYSGFCLLNTLLDHVFEAPRYERFLNGTLVFRLTKLLRLREFELAKLCHEMPALVEACTSIKDIVHCDE